MYCILYLEQGWPLHPRPPPNTFGNECKNATAASPPSTINEMNAAGNYTMKLCIVFAMPQGHKPTTSVNRFGCVAQIHTYSDKYGCHYLPLRWEITFRSFIACSMFLVQIGPILLYPQPPPPRSLAPDGRTRWVGVPFLWELLPSSIISCIVRQ